MDRADTHSNPPAFFFSEDETDELEITAVGALVDDPPPHPQDWAVIVSAFEVEPQVIPLGVWRLFVPVDLADDDEPGLFVAHWWDPQAARWVPLLSGWNPFDNLAIFDLAESGRTGAESVVYGLFELPLGSPDVPVRWTQSEQAQAERDLIDDLDLYSLEIEHAIRDAEEGTEGWLGIADSREPPCDRDGWNQAEVAGWQPNTDGWATPPVIACWLDSPTSPHMSAYVANNRPYGMIVEATQEPFVDASISGEQLIYYFRTQITRAVG
ncbi:MAG: hypothetical protein GY773_32970, partial [Actinomycetia bacterium]|nr:hypothetical protein [Actinomycetes bacterium]